MPLDDPATYALIQRAATTAVFQLESRLCKDVIRRLVPDTFDDLTALNALIRPGPQQSGMVEDFIARKQGRVPVSYPHPDLESILKPTYGVILYQEQVMQIAQVLAGYTLGGADVLRKAMGKKQPEEMANQRAVFLDGARDAPSGFPRCERDLRHHGKVRGLRIQSGSLRRVRPHRLPDRLAQGSLPGRVHGGGAVGGHGQYRQGRGVDRRMQRALSRGPSPRTSTNPNMPLRSPVPAPSATGSGRSRVWDRAR